MRQYKIILMFMIVLFILIKLQPVLKKTYLPDKIYEPNKTVDNKYGIPKIIFRTWHTKKISQKMFDNAHSTWLKQNPDYKMYWYDLEECGVFLKKINPEIYDVWANVKPLAFKADLWRVCVIYEYGGVYVDATSKPYVKLDKIIEECFKNNQNIKHKLISAKEPFNMGVHNGVIISTPKNPVLKKYMDDIVYNINNKKIDIHPHSLCGPFQYEKTLQSIFGKDLKVGLNKNKDQALYLIQLNYSINGGDIVKDGKLLLIKKFDILDCIIFKKLLNLKNDYSFLSLTGNVFEKFINW